ncbi:MAG: hypothetical protein GAK35_01070 [Herbaspirillum frisingense]|uniref:Lysozyme inhibitor LprI-like N-terminal domain-containing protein n=1 Tax=Herbaspirillum frisingense TaxID=92645 RepID=A0A7V8FYT3_9BURK|nr:MAG: hypothetical protein GAK35_01070 [Herbaspirillum frisingense]
MRIAIVAAFALVAASAFAQAPSAKFQQAIAATGAKAGGDLTDAPKIKADGALYSLSGTIQQSADDGSFLANLSPSEENVALANVLRQQRGIVDHPSYFAISVPKSLQKYYFDNAKIGSGFDVVGRYISNTKYQTVGGQQKQAPVFEAVYFELWSNRSAAPVTYPAPVAAAAPTVAAPAATPAAQQVKQAVAKKDPYTACMDGANGVMADMIECAGAEAKRQDTRLNAAYKIAMAATSDKDALRNKQRQWIKARDAACPLDRDGGQNAVLTQADCIARGTAVRANELESLK